MKTILPILFLFVFLRSGSQSSFFNQYNAALGSLNPAMVAGPDRGQFSWVGRSEWRNHPSGTVSTAFSANVQLGRGFHNLGIHGGMQSGVTYAQSLKKAGLRYGYRVLFMNEMFLCIGAGVDYRDVHIGYPYPTFFYASEFAPWPYPTKQQFLSADAGLMLLTQKGRYIGFSVRDIPVPVLPSDTTSGFRPGTTFSFHALHTTSVSRESMLLFFFGIDRGFSYGSYSGKYSLWQFQVNFYRHKSFILGAGYKRVAGRGQFNYRIGVLPWREKVLIGYSFDIKPYIWDNKIQSHSSHELMLKIKIPSKND